ncbi:MAG TPA: tRNA preQ1(34) S-adenosylmethionine ribosyltransferase-isomerase QueA [Gemmatimonadales bacterium]|nr:tRNA preQ1(34) S-adenosylmethionine ribosyltransferase-isomerase QueA [Gemmatimonadales bacterium]
MKLSDFSYELPRSQIAQFPLADRAASRLLILERDTGAMRHGVFSDFASLVEPRDVVVLNTSRVIPARLRGTRKAGDGSGERDSELLLVRETADGTWLALGHPGGKLKPGRRVTFGGDAAAEIVEVLGGGLRRIRFVGSLDARRTLEKYGEVPLPPYIRRPPNREDRERYQTVYATREGSVAAPTAGLHFTPELLSGLQARGTALARIDLHVGPGTFKPVEHDELSHHVMHAEAYEVSGESAHTINERRARGGRIWAVGTTTVRTLETVATPDGVVHPRSGETALFIHPPYTFHAVDALVSNFHLPGSTLLMLVCAFGGYERVMHAYRAAVELGYRFYSYGDAMAIL